jgi:hypothetical protein
MRKKVDRAEVEKELLPGVSPELLKELHLLTRDGDLNADARRKVKQINHLIGLLRPALEDVLGRHADPLIVDCGAGKSYLGFLIEQLVLRPAGKGQLWSIESREDLAKASADRAERLAIPRFRSIHAAVESAPLPERVHVVTALHACDTATDDALYTAIVKGADHVAVVPCCQAEVAQQLKSKTSSDVAIAELSAHPLHRRELGSHLTNVLRALTLEAHGYQVTVTELIGWEHSLKNELILGKRVKKFDRDAEARLAARLERTGATPKLQRLLAATPAPS